MARIFVSASTQDRNAFYGGGNEEQYMRLIGNEVVQILRANDHEAVLGGTVSVTDNIAKSNGYAPDYHIEIHSNAGGGVGTEAWAYPGSARGMALATAVYNRVAPVSPGKDRGVKTSANYAALSKTKAPAAIIEIAFHDNPTEAEHIRAYWPVYANAIADGLLDLVGRKPVPAPAPEPTVDYPAQIAALEAKLDRVAALAREILTIVQ